MPPSNDTLIQRALGDLAIGTAAYETAWRANTDHHLERAARTRNDQAMSAAIASQRASRDSLIGLGVPAPTVYAIEAALVIAAAEPTGERRADYRTGKFATSAGAAKFIRQTVADGGIA